jgi:tRNA(Ile)-lysidine synthase TilS/MesJ
LEPYTRKYGIQIFEGSEYDKIPLEIDSIAMPLNLDEEVINLVNRMFEGDEIILTSQNHEKCGNKIIYPLINVPSAWISDWKSEQNPECEDTILEGRELDLINFLSTFIPDVKEKMYQSAKYLEVAKLKVEQ